MPELPEVETVKESLKLRLNKKKITKARVFWDNIIAYPNKDEFIKEITEQTINDVKRRGKFIIFDLDDFYLLSHLRMEGKYFFKTENDEINKHEHVIFDLDDGTELRYMDTRKFGKMYLIKKDEIDKKGPLIELGLEPWDDKLNSKYLLEKYKNKKLPIKSVLLDQSVIVGIGNIYADEILFLSKINPKSYADKIPIKKLNEIIINTKKVFEESLKYKGTYPNIDGNRGTFEEHLLVHKRKGEKCFLCGNIITKEKVGGRGTYYCSKCQKLY